MKKNKGNKERQEIAYWRKHYDLHEFFEREWVSAGSPYKNENKTFNCINFVLTIDILKRAIKGVQDDILPDTVGFFLEKGIITVQITLIPKKRLKKNV